MIFSASPAATAGAPLGTKDGRGCGDNDQPFTFGRRPRAVAPFPFTTRQFGHLLALRGRIADGIVAADDLDASGIELVVESSVVDDTRPSLCYTCAGCGAMVP